MDLRRAGVRRSVYFCSTRWNWMMKGHGGVALATSSADYELYDETRDNASYKRERNIQPCFEKRAEVFLGTRARRRRTGVVVLPPVAGEQSSMLRV